MKLLLNIKKQNWLALLLDLVVVILGIFIALQVNKWQQGRDDSNKEILLLKQISQDISHNIKEAEAILRHHQQISEELQMAFGLLIKGNLTEKSKDDFKWAILRMNQFPFSAMTYSAYDSMLASGDFAILKDVNIKAQLVKLYSLLKLEPQLLSRFSDSGKVPLILDTISMVPHPSGKGGLWQVDFAALSGSPQALGVVYNTRRNHDILAIHYEKSLQLLKQTQSTIENYIVNSEL
ncbi:MAG: hypothetical protein HWD86_04825 [Kangiellaceae bacterium]|nr:hypothetical protein [Kangiellaceae bacterium]